MSFNVGIWELIIIGVVFAAAAVVIYVYLSHSNDQDG